MVDGPEDFRRRERNDARRFDPGRLLAGALGGWSIAGASVLMCAVLLSGLLVSAGSRGAAAQDTPKQGGTLTAAIGSDPVNLDPALSSAYSTFEKFPKTSTTSSSSSMPISRSSPNSPSPGTSLKISSATPSISARA